MSRTTPRRPTRAGGHGCTTTAPAAVVWDVVRRISTGQRTLPEVTFVVDTTTGVTTFGIGYAWHEGAHGRTDRFVVTRHDDRGAAGGRYDVFVTDDGGGLRRAGTAVTVTPTADGGATLRFDALLDPPRGLGWLVVLARPVGAVSARRAFDHTMRRIVATAEREAGADAA